jgi:hypothetical protein
MDPLRVILVTSLCGIIVPGIREDAWKLNGICPAQLVLHGSAIKICGVQPKD